MQSLALPGAISNLTGTIPNLTGFMSNLTGTIPNLTGFISNITGVISNLTGVISNTPYPHAWGGGAENSRWWDHLEFPPGVGREEHSLPTCMGGRKTQGDGTTFSFRRGWAGMNTGGAEKLKMVGPP